MSTLGLSLALGAGLAFGWLLGVYPEFDLWFSSIFYDQDNFRFVRAGDETWAFWRSLNIFLFAGALTVSCTLFAVAAFRASTAAKRHAATRAFWLLTLTAAIGPGLVVNGVLKEHWSRSRPGMVAEFNAQANGVFTPWWRTDGLCTSNCSFVAGEASIAFWLFAPAALIPMRRWRRRAYAAVIAAGSLAGLQRIAVGGHFLSDVVFAGFIVFIVVWLTYRVIYRLPIFNSAVAAQASPAGNSVLAPAERY